MTRYHPRRIIPHGPHNVPGATPFLQEPAAAPPSADAVARPDVLMRRIQPMADAVKARFENDPQQLAWNAQKDPRGMAEALKVAGARLSGMARCHEELLRALARHAGGFQIVAKLVSPAVLSGTCVGIYRWDMDRALKAGAPAARVLRGATLESVLCEVIRAMFPQPPRSWVPPR